MSKKILAILIISGTILALSVFANAETKGISASEGKKEIFLNRSREVKLPDNPERVDFDLSNKEILDLHYKGYIFEAIFMARDAFRQGQGSSFMECLEYFNNELKDKKYWPGYNEKWIKRLTECKDWKEVNKRIEAESIKPPNGEITEEFIRETFKLYDMKHGENSHNTD